MEITTIRSRRTVTVPISAIIKPDKTVTKPINTTINPTITVTKPIRTVLGDWRMALYLGFIFVLSGILTLIHSFKDNTSLSVLFGILILVSGLTETAFAIQKRGHIKGWGWLLSGGIVDYLVGCVLLIINPILSQGIVSMYVAFWLLFRSTIAIGVSFGQQNSDSLPWETLLLFVLCTFLLTYSALAENVLGGLHIYNMLGISVIILGLFKIIIAIGLKQNYIQTAN